MPANPFDQASRYAAVLDPPAFVGWAAGLAPDQFTFRGWLDTRNIPFPGEPDRTGDTVAHLDNPADGFAPWAVAVEFQTEPDPLMFGRLLTYLARLWTDLKPDPERGSRYRLGAVVVNLTGQGNASREMRWPAAGFVTHLAVRERNLERESADELLTEIEAGRRSRGLLPWLPLMTGGGGAGIIERWKRAAGVEPDPRRRSELGGLALVFANAANREVKWKQALKEWNVYRSVIVDEWKAEARVETLRSMLLRVGTKKFGRAPTRKQLAALDAVTLPERLEDLAERILDVSTWGELLAGA